MRSRWNCLVAFSCLIFGAYSVAVSGEKIVFYESFTEDFQKGDTWVVSQSSEYGGEWKHAAPEDSGDHGLLVSQKAKKYAIAAALPQAVDPKADTIVLQYDLRLQNGIECGGAYLKFLMPQEAGWTADQFKDSSPYSIMFGPDKCGATNKVHFIFRHQNPKTGEYVEHHLKTPPFPVNDKLSHVYTAVVYPNNTLKILIDGEEKKTADLLSEEFSPPVVPQKTIPDPDDKKPEDWDETPKIPDPEARKPDDWDENAPRMIEDMDAQKPEGWLDDEPLEIDDPEATKPEDWDEEEDGEWEPSKVANPKCQEAPGCGEWKRPSKKNPAYKGKWTAPFIDNPAYQGKWKPQDIPNPDYFELERPNLEPVAAVGIEIWTMNDGIVFDNILVTDDEATASEYRESTWKPKFEKEEAAQKAKEEAEEKANKKEAPKGSKGPKEQVFDALYKVAHLPIFSPVKPQIMAGLDILESKDEYAYATIGVIMLLFVAVIYCLLPAKKKVAKKVTVAQAKKEDISTPDDASAPAEEAAAEGEPEGTVKEDEGAEIKPPAEEAVQAEGSKTEEIEEEAETNVRRRSRRQT